MLLKDYFWFRVAFINIAMTPDNAIPFTYPCRINIKQFALCFKGLKFSIFLNINI